MNAINGLKMRNASETESFNPVAFYKRVSTGERTIKNFYNYGNAELSWDIDSLSTISLYANVNGGDFENSSIRNFEVIAANRVDTFKSVFYDRGAFNFPVFNWGSDFIHKFKFRFILKRMYVIELQRCLAVVRHIIVDAEP